MTRALLPLGVFVVLAVLLAAGLKLDPSEVPSPLVGGPAPGFRLPLLHDPDRVFSNEDARGDVWLFNVWASWCPACLEEHPLLIQLAQSGEVPIYGLNYKDRAEDALDWLERYGDPYVLTVVDRSGRVGIDYGVYGVPETYLIDREGVIRYKHIGALTAQEVAAVILPMVQELQR